MIKIIHAEKNDKSYSLNIIFNNGDSGELDLTNLILNNSKFSQIYKENDFNSFFLINGEIFWQKHVSVSSEWTYNNAIIKNKSISDIDVNFLIKFLKTDITSFSIVFNSSISEIKSWILNPALIKNSKKKLYFLIINNPSLFNILLYKNTNKFKT